MKQFLKDTFKLGGDGGQGSAEVLAEDGLLKARVEISFPIEKILTPISAKLKEWIPGEKYDGIVDSGVKAALGFFGIGAAETGEDGDDGVTGKPVDSHLE